MPVMIFDYESKQLNTKDLNVVKETEKAFLFEIEEVTQWVPKKCIKKNGDLHKKFSNDLNIKLARKNLFGGEPYKRWQNPDGEVIRYYFDDASYLQVTVRKPVGYYENHRFSKGEEFYKVTAHGTIAESQKHVLDFLGDG